MYTYTLKTFFFFWILKVKEKIVNYVKVLGIHVCDFKTALAPLKCAWDKLSSKLPDTFF